MPSASCSAEYRTTRDSPKITLSLNYEAWHREAHEDPDRDFILDGIVNGFKIVDESCAPESVECENYPSALTNHWKVVKQIQGELAEGRYVITAEKPKVISAMGAIDKSDGTVRLIHDCSRPQGRAVNDYALKSPKQRFQTINDALNLMTPNCYMAKVDLKSAYRSIALHPSQYPFMGLKWTFAGAKKPSFLIEKFGAQLDSHDMSISLPEEKIADFETLLQQFQGRTRASRGQLQKLAGKLSYAAHVVISGGRIYLQRVLNLIRQLSQPHHKVKLTTDFMANIKWWLSYLRTFNCKRILSDNRTPVHIFTDACHTGGGMVAPFDRAYLDWSTDIPSLQNSHVNILETKTAVMAIYRWAPALTNSDIIIHTDSMTTKAVLNKGGTRNDYIMEHLRNIFWLSKLYNFTVKCIHLPGYQNDVADSISRMGTKGHFLHSYAIASQGRPCTYPAVIDVFQYHMSPATMCHLLQTHHGNLPWTAQ